MEKEMICIRCRELIKPKDNYIEIIEWNNKKLITSFQMHKTCWKLFTDQRVIQGKALGMVKELMDQVKGGREIVI